MDIEAEQPLAHLISHMLSGVHRPDRHQGLRRRPGQAAADWPSGSRPRSPTCRASPRRSSSRSQHGRRNARRAAARRPGVLRRHRDYVGRVRADGAKGEAVSQVIEGQRRFDLVVRLERAVPHRLRQPRRAAHRPARRSRAGAARRLADIPRDGGDGPNQVNRENVRRRIVIRCNAQGRDLGGVVGRHRAARANGSAAAGGLLRRVRRAVREPAAGHAADRRPGRACRSSACSSC